MTLEACYEKMEADYGDVKRRFQSDRLIQKFALKFLNDPSYGNLCQALKEERYEDAFREAHTLKGVSQNLSFTKLHEESGKLTEALRGGASPDAKALFDQVSVQYEKVCQAIRQFQGELEG